MSTQKNDRSVGQFVFGKYIVIGACFFVALAMGRLIWWSFIQTWDWFRYMDESKDVFFVSLCFAIIFQFGQNICTFFFGRYRTRYNEFKRRMDGYKNVPDPTLGDAYIKYMDLKDNRDSALLAMTFWGLGFVVTACVDALTNIQQMKVTQEARGLAVTGQRIALNAIFGSALVFFEEGLGIVVSAFGHNINDVLEIHGNKRLAWLDLFSQGATDVLSGGYGGSLNQNKPVTQPWQPHPLNQPVHAQARQEPAYHSVRFGDKEAKGNNFRSRG